MAKQIIVQGDNFGEGWSKQNSMNLEMYNNVYINSPSIITGGEITEGSAAGTFEVAAVTAILRITNSVTAELKYITLAKQEDQTISLADTTYFVCLDYNDNTPQLALSTTNPYDRTTSPDRTQIALGKVMKDSTNNIHYISGGFNFQDGFKKLHQRNVSLRAIELGEGNVIAYSGTNNFTMTQGLAFSGVNKFVIDEFDSATTTFIPLYPDGSGGWTEGTARNTIDYNHYHDGDGNLSLVRNRRYSHHWVYRHIDDGDVYVMYGNLSGSLAQSEAEGEPAKPNHLKDFGVLIGKIIAPKAGGSYTIQQAVSTYFSGASVADHNLLGNLQGGAVTEYYHLTSAEYTLFQTYLVETGVFAALSAEADTTITTAGTYYPILGTFSNTPIQGFSAGTEYTPSVKYTQSLTRYFEIDWHASFSADAASTTVHFGIKKNGVLESDSVMGTLAKTAGEVYHLSGTDVVELETDDEIQLVVSSDGDSDVISVIHYTTTIRPFYR